MNLCMKLSTPASCPPCPSCPPCVPHFVLPLVLRLATRFSGCLWPIERKLKQNLIANSRRRWNAVCPGFCCRQTSHNFHFRSYVSMCVCVCVCALIRRTLFARADNSVRLLNPFTIQLPLQLPLLPAPANVSHVECGCQDSFLSLWLRICVCERPVCLPRHVLFVLFVLFVAQSARK